MSSWFSQANKSPVWELFFSGCVRLSVGTVIVSSSAWEFTNMLPSTQAQLFSHALYKSCTWAVWQAITFNFSSVKEATSQCWLPECHLQDTCNEIVSMAWQGRKKLQYAEWSCSQHWGNSAPCTALGGSATLHHLWLVRIAYFVHFRKEMNRTNSFPFIFIEGLHRLLIILVFIFWTPSSSLLQSTSQTNL